MPPEPTTRSYAAGLVVYAIVIIALVYGREVLTPFALAAVLAFMLAPIVSWLTKMKLRRPVAVALVMASFVGVTLVGSTVFSSQILELTASLSTYRVNLAEKAKSFSGHGVQGGVLKRAVDSVDALQREFDKGKASDAEGPIRVVVESEQARGASGMLEALRSALGPLEMLLLTLIYTAVLLAEQYDIFDRVVRLAGVENITGSTSALSEAGSRLSRLFLAQGGMNALFGLAIGVGLALLGIPNAVLWGMATAPLRFVPFVGIAIAAAPPLLLAAAVTPGWGLVFMVLALFLVGEIVLSQIIEPLVLGRHSGLSPLAIIAAGSFWSVVWGPVGLLLSAPLTMTLVVLGDYIPAMKFINLLFGNQPPLAPEHEYYHRLLSNDAPAAVEQIEKARETRSTPEICDAIVLPALRIAARDQRDQRIDAEKAEGVSQTMTEVQELLAEDGVVAATEVDPAAGQVIVAPAHGPVNSIAAEFVAFIVARAAGRDCIAVEHATGMMALSAIKASETMGALDSVVIVTVGGIEPSHLRFLARRAATDFPDARVILCNFGVESDDASRDKLVPKSVVRCATLTQLEALLHFRHVESKAVAAAPMASVALAGA